MGWVQNGSQGRVRKAECGETRPLRLERGKGREALPIVTIFCPNDTYPDLPVHLRREVYAGEPAAKENGTHGRDMCLVEMEVRGDDQG